MHSLQRKVLRTICPDQKGLIARITNICYKHELNIVQNNEFVDHRTGRVGLGAARGGRFLNAARVGGIARARPDLAKRARIE
ncbi:ACT domain-containing protein, partial [Klebsiella pneumoniae]|uniref:ACT domain-containing protein n=1 Tax=Klebsiella pneumoniae TaxID=573 RepID=UPI0030F08221